MNIALYTIVKDDNMYQRMKCVERNTTYYLEPLISCSQDIYTMFSINTFQ